MPMITMSYSSLKSPIVPSRNRYFVSGDRDVNWVITKMIEKRDGREKGRREGSGGVSCLRGGVGWIDAQTGLLSTSPRLSTPGLAL